MMKLISKIKLSFLSILIGFVVVPGFILASPKETTVEKTSENSKKIITVGEIVRPKLSDPERKKAAMILQDAFSPNHGIKKIVFITRQDAAYQALKKNLIIKMGNKDAEIAKEAVQEAEAVFHPTLGLTFSYSENETFERGKFVKLKEKAIDYPSICFSKACCADYYTVDPHYTDVLGCEAFQYDPDNQNFSDDGEADPYSLVFRYQSYGTEVLRYFEASEGSDNGPTKTKSYSVGLSQQLPWGPALSLTVTATDKDVFYDSLGHSYGASWASNAVMNLSLPLPWTKNFGPHSSKDLGIKLTEISRMRNTHLVKTSINTILNQVDQAYWNVVQNLETLVFNIKNRLLVEEQLNEAVALFEAQDAIEYDKLQAESEMTSAGLQEEISKNALISSCYALSLIIDSDPDQLQNVLYIPYDYEKILLSDTPIKNKKQSMAAAIKNRPILKLRETDIQQAQIQQRFAKDQLRPDISANASLSLAQNGATYGYKGLKESLEALDDPDTVTQSYSIAYNYPFGKKAVNASMEQANATMRLQDLQKQSALNQIERQIISGLAGIQTAKSRIIASKSYIDVAQKIYNEKASSRDEATQYELILNRRKLDQAQLTLLLSQIDLKKATSAYLYSTGGLLQNYLNDMAENDLDHVRLLKLNASGLLKYFVLNSPS